MKPEEPNPPAPFPKKEGGVREFDGAPSSLGFGSAPPSFPGKGAGGLGSSGALLGIDFGTKRIGLAVCDPDRLIASPLGTHENGPGNSAFFTELCARSKFVGVVVGLPLHSNGDESDMSRQARAFAASLADLTKLPVVMWDERCTSAAAEDAMRDAKLNWKKRKGKVDRVAAQMILQSFIEAGSPTDGTAITPRDSATPTED